MNTRAWWLFARLLVVALLIVGASAVFVLQGDGGPQCITLMTFNAAWLCDAVDDPAVMLDQEHMPRDVDAKLAGVAEVIRRHNPDIVALQEVENWGVLERLNRRHLADEGYAAYWFDSLDTATGQDVALLTRLQAAGPLRNHLDAFTTLDGKRWRLSRGLLDIRLRVPGSGKLLHVFVTHLRSQLPAWVNGRPDAYLADCQRAGQGKLVRELIQPALQAGEYVVVMGDFNDDRNSPALEFIIGDNDRGPKLYDTLARVPLADNYTCVWTDALGNRYYERVDHILVSRNLQKRVTSALIDHAVPAEVSDHAAAVVVLKL